MNPKKFIEISDSWKSYYDKQYPLTDDCIALDKQIGDLQRDIDNIYGRQLLSIGYEINGPQRLPNPKYAGPGYFGGMASQPTISNPEGGQALNARNLSLKHLEALLNARKKTYALGTCRDKIETIRQNESASLFTTASKSSENRILASSKTKQYLILGIGAVVLLTTVAIITQRK